MAGLRWEGWGPILLVDWIEVDGSGWYGNALISDMAFQCHGVCERPSYLRMTGPIKWGWFGD